MHLVIAGKYLAAVGGDSVTAEILSILATVERQGALPMPYKVIAESMAQATSVRTIRRRISKLAEEGLLTVAEGYLEGEANSYHVQEDVVAQRAAEAAMDTSEEVMNVHDFALASNENLKKWVLEHRVANLASPPVQSGHPPVQSGHPPSTKKSSKVSKKNDISLGTFLAFILETLSNENNTRSLLYTLSYENNTRSVPYTLNYKWTKSRKIGTFALSKPPKPKQKRKNSFYTWEHYSQYTPEQWKAARTDGIMPGKEQRHTLILGAYLLGLHEKHGIDVGLIPSDFNGKYGKLAKEMLDFFSNEDDGDQLKGFNRALDWIKEYLAFPKDSYYGKESWPIQMCFTRDIYRMAGKKAPSGYKSINNTGTMIFTQEQRDEYNKKGIALLHGKRIN